MATHPSDNRYIVHWETIRGQNRETRISAYDAVEARGRVTRNPDVKRIIAVERVVQS